MKLCTPQQYDLKINDDYSRSLSQNNKKCLFSKPASSPSIAKLYTVTQNNTLLYVGITKQLMSARLNQGLGANGEHDYYGYQWKDIRDVLKLSVWTVKDNNGDYINPSEIEIIEAEVAYVCRHANQWPEYQNEIHFHQSETIHRDLATAIYNAISN